MFFQTIWLPFLVLFEQQKFVGSKGLLQQKLSKLLPLLAPPLPPVDAWPWGPAVVLRAATWLMVDLSRYPQKNQNLHAQFDVTVHNNGQFPRQTILETTVDATEEPKVVAALVGRDLPGFQEGHFTLSLAIAAQGALLQPLEGSGRIDLADQTKWHD